MLRFAVLHFENFLCELIHTKTYSELIVKVKVCSKAKPKLCVMKLYQISIYKR